MKLVLIDRDGVLNEEVQDGYVECPAQLVIYPRALQALALLKANGFICVVITNQSVVGRGRITKSQLDDIHQHLCDTARAYQGEIAQVYSCTDHPDSATDRRKPGAGMLLEALKNYDADAASTVMIGDAITDLQAAKTAGCQRYLVMTGKGKLTASQLTENLYPVVICKDILDAAHKIITSHHS